MAIKKATQGQNVRITKANTQKAVDKFGKEAVSNAIGQVQDAGYGIKADSGKVIAPTLSPNLQAKINAKKVPTGDTMDTATGLPVSQAVDQSQPTVPTTPVEQAAVDTQNQPNGDQPPAGFVYGDTMDSSTGKPVLIKTEPSTPSKPTLAPSLQSKVDAKKTPVATETPVPEETTTAPVTTQPEQIKEVSDAEKNAQATGVQYTMKDGIPLYNPTTREEAVKILQMGGKLQGESKMGAVAQGTLDKVRNLGQMSDKQLSNEIVSGKVSTRELEMLTAINPELVAKAKQLSEKKSITNTTNEIQSLNNAIVNGEETSTIPTSTQELLKRLQNIDADERSPAEMKAQYQENNPEMLESRDAINDLTTQKREIERAKRDLYADYKAKNSSLPISMIMAGYSALSKGLDDQLYSINDNLNIEIANYNSYLDEMNMEMEWEIQQQGKQEDRLWKMYGVTREEEVRSEDIAREDARLEQAIQLEEQRYQRDIERQDMVSARERQQRIEDMQSDRTFGLETALMQVGVDPTGLTPEEMKSTYASAVQSQLQAEASKVKASDFLKTTITNEDGTTRDVFVDPNTGATFDPQEAFGPAKNTDISFLDAYSPQGQALLSVPDGTVIPTRLGEVSESNKVRGKECAEYVNDIAGTKMGNTYKSKTDICNEPTGGIGSVVAWKPNGSGEYGHTGIKVGEDENFEYIKSSNYVPGTVTTEAIPKGIIKNYYTPPALKQQEPTAKKYANGNVRTADGTLYTPKETTAINKDIIKNDNYKAILTSQDLNDKLTQFENEFKKYGTEVGLDKLKFNRTGKTALQNTYTSLMLTAKEFFNLGVLNGPDLAILTAGMPSPVDFELPSEGGRVTEVKGTFLNSKVEEGIKRMREMVNQKLKRDYDSVSTSFGEFGDTLPALKNAKNVYSQVSGNPVMDELDEVYN